MDIKVYQDKCKEIRELMKKDIPTELILEVHSQTYNGLDDNETLFDLLTKDIEEQNIRTIAKYKGRTTLYNIWHTSRIEDITMNSIVNNTPQVFDEDWKTRINSNITDTGNSLSEKEILKFSEKINIKELINYRNEVAKKSQEIIRNLTFSNIKRKLNKEDYQFLLEEGYGVIKDNDWLIGYWAGKDIRRIIYMPLLSHHFMHMNQSFKNKNSINRRIK